MVVIECVEENVAVYWGVKQQDLAWFTNAWRQWFLSEVEVFTVVGIHVVLWVDTILSGGWLLWCQRDILQPYSHRECGGSIFPPTTLHDVIIQKTTVRTTSCDCSCYLIHMYVLFSYCGTAKPWHNTTVTAVCCSVSGCSNFCVTGLHGHEVNMVYFECISKNFFKWSSPFIYLNLITNMIYVTFLL